MAKRAIKAAPNKAPVTSSVRQAARQVAADAHQVRVDVEQLIGSLDQLGVIALRQIVERATALIDEKTEGERRSFVEEVTARAVSLGVSISDLFGGASGKRGKTGGKSDSGKRASPPIKYRGQNEGETWTGRGRQPRWLTAAEAEGKKREDFAV